MSTSLTIPQNPQYPPSMDWLFLRREGMRHIEQLTSDIWTDYNLHDPGITFLEALCYAITDVGYRCNMNAADLFAQAEGKSFFTAVEMLPCGPVTALDYRKILIDIPGVKNAWVEQVHDAEVWFQFQINVKLFIDTLSPYFEKIDANAGDIENSLNALIAIIEKGIPLFIREINECQPEKDRESKKMAFKKSLLNKVDLSGNTSALAENLRKAILLYFLDRYYPEWITFLADQLSSADDTEKLALMRIQLATLGMKKADDSKLLEALQLLVDFVKAGPQEISDFVFGETLLTLLFAGSLQVRAIGDPTDANSYNIFIPQGIYSVTLQLEPDRAGDEADIKEIALRKMHRHRNLCEDIHPEVHIVEYIDMGIRLSVAIDPEWDTLEVMAQIYHCIQHYLSPDIRFYSLEEMMNRYAAFTLTVDSFIALQGANLPQDLIDALSPLLNKKNIGDTNLKKELAKVWDETALEDYYDDVFLAAEKQYDADPVYNGPLLKHGFIEEKELLLAQPRQTVYRSDLYQVVAAVEGVLQIDRLEIYKCGMDKPEKPDWCLSFECRCLPQLKLECSELTISSHGVEIPLKAEKLIEYIESHPESTTKLNRKGTLDLPVPQGRIISDLTDYTSVQEDLPRTYKVGNTGISRKESELRQGEVKQLKGYLLFYDQLLANALSHLASVKNLLSVTPTKTDPYQPLFTIPFIREVLLDYAVDMSWDNFVPGADDPYIKILQQLSEGNPTARNMFQDQLLDHLLARFGEQFTDYALQLFRIERPLDNTSDWEANAGLEESIKDKQRFLSLMPSLAASRAEGFNYRFNAKEPPRYWNTDAVEGVKKRVCVKLGIDDFTRHTLTCEPGFVVEVGPRTTPGSHTTGRTRYEFYIRKDDQSTSRLLVSTMAFSSSQGAENASADFLNMAVDKNNYGHVDGRVGFWVGVEPTARTTDNALMLEPKADPEEIEKRLQYIQDLASRNCEEDGFHLLEHILLRPRNDAYTQLLKPMLCCLENLEWLDPYSFWVTVVIPGWSGRFSDEARRQAFVQTVLREMPAQLEVRFCSVTREGMFQFEKVYHEWLRCLCSEKQDGLAQATNDLVQLMNGWQEDQIIQG